MILPPLQFYVKSNFGEVKRSKNFILGNSSGSEFDYSKFEQLSSPKFTNISRSVSKIAKNDIFGLFEFAKIWFHVKLEWR